MRHKKMVVQLAILAAVIGAAVNATTLIYKKGVLAYPAGKEEKPLESGPLPRTQVAATTDPDLISRGLIASQLHAAFDALGDRLQRPGKERIAATGMLLHVDDAQPTPFLLVWELPGRLRLEQQVGSATRVLIFDGQSVTSSDSKLSEGDQETLELMIYDSVEHFFVGQATGVGATRFLGRRFRRDGDTSNTPYDLVEITEAIGLAGKAGEQTRTYYFNSDTHLLERVSHPDHSSGSEIPVDVLLSDWRVVGGQQISHRIERRENNKVTLTVALSSVAVLARGAGPTGLSR